MAQYAEGESVTALKLVRSAGIDPATGKEIYIKKNGELTFTYDPADKVLIGDTEPAFTGTVNTVLYYKGFSLYALFSIRYGAWLYNTTRVTKVEGSDPKRMQTNACLTIVGRLPEMWHCIRISQTLLVLNKQTVLRKKRIHLHCLP